MIISQHDQLVNTGRWSYGQISGYGQIPSKAASAPRPGTQIITCYSMVEDKYLELNCFGNRKYFGRLKEELFLANQMLSRFS